MKKICKTLCVALIATFGFSTVYAQDMAQATEIFNGAVTALNEDRDNDALTGFQKAMEMAAAAGEEGATLVNDCKGVIPGILLKMGQTAANNQDIDGAIAKLNEAVAKAEEYGNAEIAAKAKDLIPVVIMADGNTLYNAKQYAEAIAEFEKVLQYDPENGMAYLMIGRAKNGLGDEAAAVANLEKAATMGQQANANKLLLGIFANKAAAAYKGKNNAAAYENAVKASEYGDNAQVYMIGGIAAYNLKKYDQAVAMLGMAKRLGVPVLQASTSEIYGDPAVHPQKELDAVSDDIFIRLNSLPFGKIKSIWRIFENDLALFSRRTARSQQKDINR